MNRTRRTALSLQFLVTLLLPALAFSQDDQPTTPHLLLADSAQIAYALHALSGCDATAQVGINKNGIYTQIGKLFNSSIPVAVLDGSDSVIFCQWFRHGWHPISYIDEAPDWKFPGWTYEAAHSREPETIKPFWTQKLQNRDILVVAGEMRKYHQVYNLFLIDPGLKRLLDQTSSIPEPLTAESKYLITRDISPNKAEFGELSYLVLRSNRFHEIASWSEFLPYSQPEGDTQYSCSVAVRSGRAFTITDDYSISKNPASLVIYNGNVIKDNYGSSRAIANAWESNTVFAKLYSRFGKLGNGDSSEDLEMEQAYLFEKLTGISRRYFAIDEDWAAPYRNDSSKRLEKNATIRVTGTREASRLLAPNSR